MTLKSVLMVLLSLGATPEMASDVAPAALRESRNVTELSFLLAWASHESRFQRRIADNKCKPWECDRGRAIGLWQLHRGAAGAAWYDLPGNIDAQARVAARMTRWSLRQCDGDVRCAWRMLGGLPKNRPLRGESDRVATYVKVLGALR